MSNYYENVDNNNANNNAINSTNTNSTNTAAKTNVKPKMYEDFLFFGNFFGLVPEAYVKYFNLFAIQITSTLIFAGIYYILLSNFDKYFFIQEGFPKKQFLDNKLGIALIMSINFQTTTAYVDIKCKTFLARSLFSLQIVCAFAIAFLFFL